MTRTILFAEVPFFYAAIERADDPSLAGRPVIVGGDPRKRGLVQSATPEARAAGVTLDMPMLEALQLCPTARALRTNMARYREVSRRLFACLRRGFERLEPFGLAAAYFELGGEAEPAERVAQRLCERVREELGLSLRVGVASRKLLARLAAEEAGGGGVRRIASGEEEAFFHPLSLARLEGVGQKTAASLAELGARTIGDVVALDAVRLEAALGAHGLRIQALARGAEDDPVRGVRHPQSLSREATVRGESIDLGVLADHLQDLARHLAAELGRQGLSAGRVILKIRYGDQTTTRSQTLAAAIGAAGEIHDVAAHLLERTQAGSRPVRGLGIQLAGLAPAAETSRQLDLFRPRG
jgi:nucleotidyltransferase/DNA polymerase involved in DNA repair